MPGREKKNKGQFRFENIEYLLKYNAFNVNAVKMTETKQLKKKILLNLYLEKFKK